MKRSNSKTTILVIVIAVVVFALALAGINATRNIGKSAKTISTESATTSIDKMLRNIEVTYADPVKSQVDLLDTQEEDELPDIDKNEITVNEDSGLYVEIFTAPERSGSDKDGWMNEMAEKFNREDMQVNDQDVSVRIRNVTSGLAMEYIATGKYVPDGFSPSNAFWGKMLEADDVRVQTVAERLVGNVPILMFQNDTYDELMKKYGALNLKTVVEATANGEITMGYTNPYASSTGLNFLISTLQTYSPSDPLSDEAVAGFQTFQANVPFVAYNTPQMKTAVESGSLTGLIYEYQAYQNDKELQRKYKAVPFGFRHDGPLYAVGNISDEKLQILQMFADYCLTDEAQALATEYGFNGMDDYICEQRDVSGDDLLNAQELWKEEKDNGKPVIAVFVADVSGSMDGEPINMLRQSLINGMKYIGKDNYVGLVSYSDDVTVNVPVGKFDLNHQSAFKGGVESLETGGGTATFDGIIVGIHLLQEAMAEYPEAKPMLFVLSDGQSNRGYDLSDIREPLDALNIPVYTIGYNADIDALSQISAINEAASINADTDDVVYKIKNLFNANL